MLNKPLSASNTVSDTHGYELLDYLYGGVNHSLLGNGGPSCVNYISMEQRIIETVLLVPLFIAQTFWSAKKIPKLTHTLKLTCQAHKQVC